MRLLPLFLIALLAACSPKPQPEPEPEPSSAAPAVEAVPRLSDREAGARFLSALKSGDGALKPYGWRDDMTVQERAHMEKLRQIAATQTLVAVEFARGGPIGMIVFLRPEDEGRLFDPQWRKDSYMKTLFACNFEDSSATWKFTDPMYCYSDGSNPFAD